MRIGGKRLAIHKRYNRYLSWDQFYQISELLGKVDFGCKFKKEGGCNTTFPMWETPKCCCKSCKREVGYLHKISKEGARAVKEHWDDELGFLRPELKGCSLPRQFRSRMCLTYSCHYKASRSESLSLIDVILRFPNNGVAREIVHQLQDWPTFLEKLERMLCRDGLLQEIEIIRHVPEVAPHQILV